MVESLALIAAVVSTVSVIGPALGFEQGTVLAVAVPALFGSAFLLIAGRRALATRTIPAQIAIGGSQGVGKTVYTNVVAGRLGEGQSSTLRFTPEARTAQQVYRIVSELRRERWPPSTAQDHIDRYRGKVELVHQPLINRLAQGRTEFSLELGDSAGELWDEVADLNTKRSSWLIDSTFFEYVGESSVLLYFIAADTVKSNPEQVADHVDDLLSTLQVLRSIESQATPQLTKPIGVVISKADLLNPLELGALRSMFGDTSDPLNYTQEESDLARLDKRFLASMERLEHMTIVMNRQVRAFEGFVISSLRAAQQHAGTTDPLAEVERPIEWAVRQILRS